MEPVALHKRVIGLDVHQAQITACAILTEAEGATRVEQRRFGAFMRDRCALVQWAVALCPDSLEMESTGIYWKSPYAALEAKGIRAQVVNARHVKDVPGQELMRYIKEIEARIARFDVRLLCELKVMTRHEAGSDSSGDWVLSR